VLAALGLTAATLAFESGIGLRSRSLLWPEAPMTWEVLDRPGQAPKRFSLSSDGALELFHAAVDAAKSAHLSWPETPVVLTPSKELLKLVRLSQLQAVQEGPDEK
jgi:hypothetical protein